MNKKKQESNFCTKKYSIFDWSGVLPQGFFLLIYLGMTKRQTKLPTFSFWYLQNWDSGSTMSNDDKLDTEIVCTL